MFTILFGFHALDKPGSRWTQNSRSIAFFFWLAVDILLLITLTTN